MNVFNAVYDNEGILFHGTLSGTFIWKINVKLDNGITVYLKLITIWCVYFLYVNVFLYDVLSLYRRYEATVSGKKEIWSLWSALWHCIGRYKCFKGTYCLSLQSFSETSVTTYQTTQWHKLENDGQEYEEDCVRTRSVAESASLCTI
jgi:hypothetical protein